MFEKGSWGEIALMGLVVIALLVLIYFLPDRREQSYKDIAEIKEMLRAQQCPHCHKPLYERTSK